MGKTISGVACGPAMISEKFGGDIVLDEEVRW
jgi:hypothetical protein